MKSLRTLLLFVIATAPWVAGCTRTRYRQAADRDSYQIIQEKSACLSQQVPDNFTVRPDPRSRFYDPTNPDCPQLPVPRPVLRGYELPALASDALRQPAAPSLNQQPMESSSAPPQPEQVPPPPPQPAVKQVSHEEPVANGSGLIEIAPATMPVADQESIQPQTVDASKGPASNAQPSNPRSEGAMVNRVIIPAQAWEVLPRNCLTHMLQFPTLQQEYAASFPGSEIPLVDQQTRRLSLANLMELAFINSREYQARKEILYRTALTLTRQRYQYELNPIPFGNGTSANYSHLRTGGIEQNTLGIPSGLGVQKTLATSGQFLAQFANSVVLTFNGPQGFATDIGSELVFDFQQTLLQRDIRFEALTQNERDVIYAARDYLRFRKQLFRDISGLYYNLLVSYRGIEINAQDYFTNLRGFLQSQAEYRTAEKIPRIQVDQFEQNVLRTRGNLVNNCFALESSLDQFKFRLGLPTEMPIQLDLTELESIALKDELSVARQMITRARRELLTTRNTANIDATTLANVAEVLADRMANILRIQARMDAALQSGTGASTPGAESTLSRMPDSSSIASATRELEQLQHMLRILGVRMQIDVLRAELDSQTQADNPAPALRVLIRAVDLISAELEIIDLALSGPGMATSQAIPDLEARSEEIARQFDDLQAFLDQISANVGAKLDSEAMKLFEQIPERMQQSVKLAEAVRKLTAEATEGILPVGDESLTTKVQLTVDSTIKLSDKLLEKGPDGWEEIVLDQDEALLTGLVQRLDLMNQRGQLADAWRQIKLAGDDLRSIINLRATQVLRTDSTQNQPFDFTFDDSETRVSASLDTPLNRRLQRNNFRLALINYNVGLRNLMAAEDSIKLDIREDLRQLALDRSQYTISVASAALAYERVISTRMRLQLAVQNVAARDFLEAQQAYTAALSSIARQHVNYITDRTELFFDLEAFDVDNNGHWPGVDGDYGPQINVDFPTTNPRPYDCLPPRVRYSPTIRQMEQIPPGNAIVK